MYKSYTITNLKKKIIINILNFYSVRFLISFLILLEGVDDEVVKEDILSDVLYNPEESGNLAN